MPSQIPPSPDPRASSAPRVAVATVSYRSAPVLEAFLDSVGGASVAAPRIVLADNAPEARVAHLAERYGADYLPLEGNPGYGGAVNAAVSAMPPTVEWVLVTNPDVVLGPGAIDGLVEAGDRDPRIAAVGPRILTAEGQTYPSARVVPSLRTGVGHALFANIWPGNPWSRSYHLDGVAPETRAAGWLSGACLLIRRSAFDEIGGFDTGYFMYFEDVDLGYRLGRAGWRNLYEPSAVVMHTGAHSTTSESARMIRAHHESAKRFIEVRYPGAFFAPLRGVLRLGLSLRSLIQVRRQREHL